ncbi:MAG: hypothetical protein OEV74_16790 [Cyclobacteriaceae bacterium]|nr:hypothetical protein [Cyclobacteriaceae bacterium]MDH4297937.1 hypothetical protein [Cyclobacteriaceae bacterium]MDH5250931.1 hypothetical protein [Cyclobacteriaceae bacterium]
MAIIFISGGRNSIVLLFVIFINDNAFVLQSWADSYKIPYLHKAVAAGGKHLGQDRIVKDLGEFLSVS